MARAPGCPTSPKVKGGWEKEGSEVAKSLSPSFSFLLLALGYGFRKQRRRRRRRRSWMEANGQVNPKRPLSLHIYLPRGAHPPPRPKSTAFSAVDFAITDGWAPRPRSLPRAHAAINVARQPAGAARLLRYPIRQPPPTPLRLPEAVA